MEDEEKYKYIRVINNTNEAIEIIDCIDLDNDNSVNRGIDKMQEVCKKILEDIDNPKIKAIATDPFFTFDKTPLLHKAMEIFYLFREDIELLLKTRAGNAKRKIVLMA